MTNTKHDGTLAGKSAASVARRRRWLSIPLLTVGLGLASCGEGSRKADTATNTSADAAVEAAAEQTPSSAPVPFQVLAPSDAAGGQPLGAAQPAFSWHQDVIYFVMPDRFHNGDAGNDTGGLAGAKRDHGFDPTDKAFFHGGDLKGLLAKLDYLQTLGVTAIWMTPIFKNKPVQGEGEQASAGYHGYWITDFTRIDPHLGENDDLKALVDAAHQRGMKVIFDIVTNHTANVIEYEECTPRTRGEAPELEACTYRSLADYPYTVRAADGAAINDGFLGDAPPFQTAENFARIGEATWAYTPYIPSGEETVKVPTWLNDPLYYHNRGETTFQGENSLYGDFASLDDVFTEHPRVQDGMIDIFKEWISQFRIDGFRVDTVRHVNDSFWQKVSPALIQHAKSAGIGHFYIFGEVYDPNPEHLSHFTRVAKLPAVLDFGFQSVVAGAVLGDKPAAAVRALFELDDLYTEAGKSANHMPTFVGNHDMGRIGHFIASNDVSDEAALAMHRQAHMLMMTLRGVPVIYYGDEQGMTGDGHDQDARENMDISQVASYRDNRHIGGGDPGQDNFNTAHPVFGMMQDMIRLRRQETALQSGSLHFYDTGDPAVLAFSRLDHRTGEQIVVVANFSAAAKTPALALGTQSAGAAFQPLTVDTGGDTVTADAEGVLSLSLGAHGIAVMKAGAPLPRVPTAPAFAAAQQGRWLVVNSDGQTPARVDFYHRTESGWQPAGSDQNPPYRLYLDPAIYGEGEQHFMLQAHPYGHSAQSASLGVDIRP